MKTCNYCGLENEPESTHCRGCGWELRISKDKLRPVADHTAPGPNTPPPLSAADHGCAESLKAADTLSPSATLPESNGPAKNCWFAVTSVIAGLMGFCFGYAAFLGLICGIIGLVRINRSKGRLISRGIAIAGLCLSGVACLLLLLLLPAQARARARMDRIMCVNKLKQLAAGVRLYSSNHQGQYPSGQAWCDDIAQHVSQSTVFQCPLAHDTSRCTYALNAKVSGLEASKINPETVIIFEAAGGWNLSGGMDLMLKTDRHIRAYNVALADGSVKMVLASKVSELRWDP